MKLKITLIALSLLAAAPALSVAREPQSSSLSAAPDNKAEKARLQARFEARYPDIKAAKSQGKIGETSEGFLEAVSSADKATQKLMDEENTDRRALYKLLANEEGTEESVVAQRAAQRNFKKARKGEFVKDGSTWMKKK